MATGKPIIGIPADRRLLEPHLFHMVGEKYITAVTEAAQARVVLIPSLGAHNQALELLADLDGILLTGSPSNVEPQHYGGTPSAPGTKHDAERDSTTLPLIPAALEAGVPLFAVCRGFQELNVALGGTLHQRTYEVAGLMDHREDTTLPVDGQYAPAHDVELVPGGVLHALAGRDRVRVNSLHSQGVDRLAAGLAVEATAPDGLIEGFRVAGAPAFALAVQWHPEWRVMSDDFSRALFAAFGDAARARRAQRNESTGQRPAQKVV